jgi:hypothetical protein
MLETRIERALGNSLSISRSPVDFGTVYRGADGFEILPIYLTINGLVDLQAMFHADSKLLNTAKGC